MLTLVLGGAASGKSAYAESLVLKTGLPRYYLATMQVWDAECAARVEKHRKMRAQKQFETLECPAEVAAMIDLARAQGIIKGYKTLVDWEKAGVNRVEAVIELNVSPKKSRGFDEIAATIASFDEVESVLLMSGGYDLQLVIKGQTFQEIALFVAKRLSPLDDVLSTATHFVLRTYKKEGRLYQDEEIDERECTVL